MFRCGDVCGVTVGGGFAGRCECVFTQCGGQPPFLCPSSRGGYFFERHFRLHQVAIFALQRGSNSGYGSTSYSFGTAYAGAVVVITMVPGLRVLGMVIITKSV
jgi:hypothetical protein